MGHAMQPKEMEAELHARLPLWIILLGKSPVAADQPCLWKSPAHYSSIPFVYGQTPSCVLYPPTWVPRGQSCMNNIWKGEEAAVIFGHSDKQSSTG